MRTPLPTPVAAVVGAVPELREAWTLAAMGRRIPCDQADPAARRPNLAVATQSGGGALVAAVGGEAWAQDGIIRISQIRTVESNGSHREIVRIGVARRAAIIRALVEPEPLAMMCVDRNGLRAMPGQGTGAVEVPVHPLQQQRHDPR